jgi:hypothetical protein
MKIPEQDLSTVDHACPSLDNETADLSTTLRSGRDDNSSLKRYFLFPNRIVIPTGGVMGVRPTQEDEKRATEVCLALYQGTTLVVP